MATWNDITSMHTFDDGVGLVKIIEKLALDRFESHKNTRLASNNGKTVTESSQQITDGVSGM
jgi:hypothetical protein